MERIEIKQSLEKVDMYKSLWNIEVKINEIIEWINKQEKEGGEHRPK